MGGETVKGGGNIEIKVCTNCWLHALKILFFAVNYFSKYSGDNALMLCQVIIHPVVRRDGYPRS